MIRTIQDLFDVVQGYLPRKTRVSKERTALILADVRLAAAVKTMELHRARHGNLTLDDDDATISGTEYNLAVTERAVLDAAREWAAVRRETT